MNVERLHAIMRALEQELDRTAQIPTLESLIGSVTNMANSPQTPDYQQQTSDNRTKIQGIPDRSSVDDWPAAWQEVLVELGIRDLFGAAFVAQVESSFSANEVTPATIATDLQPLLDRLTALNGNLVSLLSAFESFEIGYEQLAPGQVEITVLIPRTAVHNDLRDLGREFQRLDRILKPFAEIATGSRAGFEVRAISSSEFGVFLNSVPGTVLAFSVALNTILSTYKTFLEVREMRAKLKGIDVPEEALQGLTVWADGVMKEAISHAVDETMQRAELHSAGRENELRIDLTRSLEDIARRIDEGYDFDVRGEPEQQDPDDPTISEVSTSINTINEISPTLKFIERPGQGLLSLGSATAEAEDEGLSDVNG